jgi:hypothetical protein
MRNTQDSDPSVNQRRECCADQEGMNSFEKRNELTNTAASRAYRPKPLIKKAEQLDNPNKIRPNKRVLENGLKGAQINHADVSLLRVKLTLKPTLSKLRARHFLKQIRTGCWSVIS